MVIVRDYDSIGYYIELDGKLKKITTFDEIKFAHQCGLLFYHNGLLAERIYPTQSLK